MKEEHHALIVAVTADILKFWSENGKRPKFRSFGNIVNLAKKNNMVRYMKRWVAQPDDLKDVVVHEGLAKAIVNMISKATRFQHFAYCGSMDDLEYGDSKVSKYDGYCWDCDPFLPWYTEIADISWADVEFNPRCGFFSPEFFMKSPGAIKISGKTDWDDQIYPSAIEMANFYGNGNRQYEHKDKKTSEWSLQSLCFAIHMLHDLCVPHHVLCTIAYGHAEFEEKMLSFWRRLYSDRSTLNKNKFLTMQIEPLVREQLEKYKSINDFTGLGEQTVDITSERLPTKDTVPSINKIESKRMTAQGIACTIKALELFFRKEGKTQKDFGELEIREMKPKSKKRLTREEKFKGLEN